MASFGKSYRKTRFRSLADLYTDFSSTATVVTNKIISISSVVFDLVVEFSITTVTSSPPLNDSVVFFED